MNTQILKVGVILVSHKRESPYYSLQLLEEGIKLWEECGIKVYFSNAALVTDKDVREEIIKLKKEDIETYIIVLGNWIEPPQLCHPLEEIRDRNILLLGYPESLKLISEGHFLGSNSAFTVIRNALDCMGFKFKAVQKFPNDPECVKDIFNFILASLVSKLIRKIKIGLIGYCSMGIYTACFDQLKIREVFGIEIDTYSDSYLLYKEMYKISKDEINLIKADLERECNIDDVVIRNKSLDKSIRMYLALKNMIKEREWSGVSVKCQHEFSTYLKCTACLPLSLLTDEGIVCTDEGDVHALITMIIMKFLSRNNSPLYFGDIYKLNEGGFLMTHCGLSPHSCADEDSKINLLPQNPRISEDGEKTGGVVSSYIFKKGRVSLGRIGYEKNGKYVFHFCSGYIEDTILVSDVFAGLVLVLDKDEKIFAENQLSNHYVLIYDDICDRIEEFCNITGLKIIR